MTPAAVIAEREQLHAHPHRYPGLRPLPDAFLRVWRRPTFEAWASWSVHPDDARGDALWVRRIVSGPSRHEPSQLGNWGAEARLVTAELAPLRDELIALAIPAWVPSDRIGIDGVISGIEAGNRMCSSSYQWWGRAPAAYAALEDWHRRARALFEAALPEWSAQPWR